MIAHAIVASSQATTSVVDIVGTVAVSIELVAFVYILARGVAWWIDQQKEHR